MLSKLKVARPVDSQPNSDSRQPLKDDLLKTTIPGHDRHHLSQVLSLQADAISYEATAVDSTVGAVLGWCKLRLGFLGYFRLASVFAPWGPSMVGEMKL